MELKVEYSSFSLLNELWSGARENAERLCRAGLWDRCYDLIEDMADGELSLTDVNDMLMFDFGYLLESIGYRELDDGSIIPLGDGDIE